MLANLKGAVDVLRDTDKGLEETLLKQLKTHQRELLDALASQGFYVLTVSDGRSFRITRKGEVVEENTE